MNTTAKKPCRWQAPTRKRRPPWSDPGRLIGILYPSGQCYIRKQVKEMYINADTIIKAASLLAAIGALVGAIIAVHKTLENNRKQNDEIKAIKEEQTIICYALKGALQGLIESGCNGPCKDALDKLDKHLNQSAHKPDL